MNIHIAQFPEDLEVIQKIAQESFSETPDSSLSEWFSFEEMQKEISENRGICLKAVAENNEVVGLTYAQQESPINGKEGREKWVIIIAGVKPTFVGKSVGSELLKTLEQKVKELGCKKLFTFTNKDDEQVIRFYHNNGFQDAGWIKDYQYGEGNSAVFLLKLLQ